MKLEVGKYYRTRDGRKVGPIYLAGREESGHPWQCKSTSKEGAPCWTSEGLIGWKPVGKSDLIAEWTDEPETGTLAELNVKPGDVVEFVKGCHWWKDGKQYVCDSKGYLTDETGEKWQLAPKCEWRIISRASQSTTPASDVATPTSPVRTITRKEIVPGVYGRVRVGDVDGSVIGLEFEKSKDTNLHKWWTADELTAAINTMTEIRKALENT